MDVFDGLEGYEAILLMLGASLFVVLVALIIFLVLQRRSIRQVMILFPMPVVMMGFPGISKIKCDGGVIEIERMTREVERNPADTNARAELAKRVAEIERRPISSNHTQLTIAKAQVALGERSKALATVNRALATQSPQQLPEAVRLRDQLLRVPR